MERGRYRTRQRELVAGCLEGNVQKAYPDLVLLGLFW